MEKETENSFYEEVKRRMDALSENDVLVFDIFGELPHNEKFLTRAYVLLLCREGKASCRVGDKVHEMGKGDLFLCQPKLLVENAMASLDFKCQGLVVSENYFESILFLGGRVWDAKVVARERPVIHLSDEEMEIAIRNNNFLHSKLEGPKRSHYEEQLRLLLQSLAYEFYDILIGKLPLEAHSYTSAENLFSRFMDMASAETPRQREVKYYADRLCVTPKYLSSVCKQMSGTPASVVLGNMVMEFVKRELRTSTKTVKEIADAAGFQNLSFFGKYVRRELGMSPRAFRSEAQATGASTATTNQE